MRLFHLLSAVVLLVSHSIFLASGLYITKRKLKPRFIDWASRFLSQIGLAAVLISGIFLLASKPLSFFPHIFTGILPLVSIPTIFFIRIAIKKRKSLPWLLPVTNLILISAAFLTGLLYIL